MTISINAFSQSENLYSKSDTVIIKSKIFSGNRKIIISHPTNFQGNIKDCILYLDGQNTAMSEIITQSAENLYWAGDIPPCVLVGIFHEKRDEELTEKTKLYHFILDEVIPYLSDKHKINSKITIVGHSFGGYFATHCFLKNNHVFNSCVAISPTYWANEKDVFKTLQSEKNNLSGNLFLAIGDSRWLEISNREFFFDFAKDVKRDTKGVNLETIDLKGFSHNSAPIVGTGMGLNFCFNQYSWEKTLKEQEQKTEDYPEFWKFYEIKADALLHLNRKQEANQNYKIAIQKIKKDNDVDKNARIKAIKSLKNKIKQLNINSL